VASADCVFGFSFGFGFGAGAAWSSAAEAALARPSVTLGSGVVAIGAGVVMTIMLETLSPDRSSGSG
jgi:hypothetical protein